LEKPICFFAFPGLPLSHNFFASPQGCGAVHLFVLILWKPACFKAGFGLALFFTKSDG
jgi:hypothetical protein